MTAPTKIAHPLKAYLVREYFPILSVVVIFSVFACFVVWMEYLPPQEIATNAIGKTEIPKQLDEFKIASVKRHDYTLTVTLSDGGVRSSRVELWPVGGRDEIDYDYKLEKVEGEFLFYGDTIQSHWSREFFLRNLESDIEFAIGMARDMMNDEAALRQAQASWKAP